MVLSFSSSTPTSGAVDFYINKSLEVVFNEALDTAYITTSTIYLYDLIASVNVPISITRKATDTSALVVTPTSTLKENTNYRLVIVGQDQGIGTRLQAVNGDLLLVSIQVLFATGDNTYSIDTETEKNASNITLEGDLFLPTNIAALGYEFTISKVRPPNHSHGLTGSVTGVVFTFTKDLLTGQDLTTWTDVNVYPLLQETIYLASGSVMDLGTNTITIPNYSLSMTGSTFTVSFGSALPKNVAISIELNTNIRSLDNDQYAGNLNYISTTALFPTVYGTHLVKTELSAISNQIQNDYIGTLLFKNTIWLWERLGRTIPLTAFPFAAKRHILLSTILDIIEDKDYKKFVIAGTRRQLGDLNVSVDNLIGRLAMKASRVQKERDLAFETLVKGWQFRKSAYVIEDSQFFGSRLWYDVNSRNTDPNYKYYQEDKPASNTSINRQAKTTNPIW
jgi:hypothetical protein